MGIWWSDLLLIKLYATSRRQHTPAANTLSVAEPHGSSSRLSQSTHKLNQWHCLITNIDTMFKLLKKSHR